MPVVAIVTHKADIDNYGDGRGSLGEERGSVFNDSYGFRKPHLLHLHKSWRPGRLPVEGDVLWIGKRAWNVDEVIIDNHNYPELVVVTVVGMSDKMNAAFEPWLEDIYTQVGKARRDT